MNLEPVRIVVVGLPLNRENFDECEPNMSAVDVIVPCQGSPTEPTYGMELPSGLTIFSLGFD